MNLFDGAGDADGTGAGGGSAGEFMDGDDGDEDNAQGSFSAGRREVKAEATTAAAATGIAARFGRAGHVPPAQCSLPA